MMAQELAYTLDTSILVGMQQRYPRDIFPGVWDSLEEMVAAGRVCICYIVLEELKRGGDPLHDWAKGLDGFLCAPTQEEIALVDVISKRHPDWVSGTTNAADPWVIAHAATHKRGVVTEENRAGVGVADRNQKIPNVAAEVGVGSMKFFEFARGEGWEFR